MPGLRPRAHARSIGIYEGVLDGPWRFCGARLAPEGCGGFDGRLGWCRGPVRVGVWANRLRP